MSNWCHEDGWYIQYGDIKLHIVAAYKHLVTYITLDGTDIKDARHKACSAMCAYAPLATKIFGSSAIYMNLKLIFLESLVLSRLLFNAHIRVPSVGFIRILNQVYMRVVRRISNKMRFDKTAITDRAVRALASQPSIDCLLMRKRLIYLPRVWQSVFLRAVLAVGAPSDLLPWTKLILDDLVFMSSHVPNLASFGRPSVEHSKWRALIHSSEWPRLVNQICFVDSVADVRTEMPMSCKTFQCNMCPDDAPLFFPTHRALKCHQRKAHGCRSSVKKYADADGVCICCGTVFSSRLRLVAHLTDRRRPKCWEYVQLHGKPLSDYRCEELDAADRAAQTEARRQGHTQPMSSAPARTKDGRAIGRVHVR